MKRAHLSGLIALGLILGVQTLSVSPARAADACVPGRTNPANAIRQPGPADSVKIMPLGDSITRGNNPQVAGPIRNGWRESLFETLRSAGDSVDFVGSQNEGSVATDDNDHEGHQGWCINQVRDLIDKDLAAQGNPQIIDLMLGTNDILQGHDVANAPARMQDLLNEICVQDPGTHIALASLPTMGNTANRALRDAFNAALPGVVTLVSAGGCEVRLVSMDSLTVGDISTDGVHPALSGYVKMQAAWQPVDQAFYDEIKGSPAVVPPVDPPPPPPPSPVNGLSASYWSNTTFAGAPTVTEVDPVPNFAWGSSAPAAGVPMAAFSARWTANITPAVSGTYTFYTVADGAVSLSINGVKIINDSQDPNKSKWNQATITLTAGQAVPLTLTYVQTRGASVVGLRWSATGVAYSTPPTSAFTTTA